MIVLAPMRLEAVALRHGGRGAAPMRVRRVGVGPERARAHLAGWDAPEGEEILVAGLCGSLDPSVAVGHLVVPDELRGPAGQAWRCAGAGLADTLRAAGFVVHEGPLAGADHAVTGAERQALAGNGAIAVDMESPWIAEALHPKRVGVVRVVLDAPGQELFRLSTGVRLLRCLGALSRVARVLRGADPSVAPVLRRSS